MPAPKRTTKSKKVEPVKKKAAPSKSPPPVRQAERPKLSSAEVLRRVIAYYYLLSYCAPKQIGDFLSAAGSLRKSLVDSSGMEEGAFFSVVAPEVCRRIVAFHQDTREPDKAVVEALIKTIQNAEKNPESLAAFQAQMAAIASLPGRAKPENRLHRTKGCNLCAAPCRYGYFTLISDPQFNRLREMMASEAAKPASEQSPLGLVYGFTFFHLSQFPGFQQGWIDRGHLGNLAFCLLLLGMAKSRLAMPEEQLRLFQAANQEYIKRL